MLIHFVSTVSRSQNNQLQAFVTHAGHGSKGKQGSKGLGPAQVLHMLGTSWVWLLWSATPIL